MAMDDTKQQTVDDILNGNGGDSTGSDRSDLIENPEMLKIEYVPQADNIVGRDDHLTYLAENLRNMRTDDAVDNVIEWGESGTGKTLVAKHVCERLEAVTADTDSPIVSAYVNPDPGSTYTSTWRKITEEVNAKSDNPQSIPGMGVSADIYRNRMLWPMIREEFPGGLVVIIDEIDKHPEINDVLYTLSRTKQKDDVDVPVKTIGISNDLTFEGELGSRVNSTLQPIDRSFTSYDDEQLIAIMENRRDAFYDGALDDDVIPKIADLAAKEHGDARRAVSLLRYSGQIAEQNGASSVTVDHVDEAEEKVEVQLFMEHIEGTSLATKLLLFALSRLHRNNPDQDEFRTSRVHEVYEQIARDCGEKPRSRNRALELLNEQTTLGILSSEKREGGDDGTYRSYTLESELDATREGLLRSTPELSQLMG